MDLVEADLQNDKGKHGLKLVDLCLQNGTSPLYAAAQNGHVETVEYLCNANADRSLKSGGAVSPFFIAAQKGHCDPIINFWNFNLEQKKVRKKQGVL